MYCRNCGKEISENTRFCPKCGVQIGVNESKEKNIEQKKKTFLCIGILLILIVISVFYMKKKDVLTGEVKNKEEVSFKADEIESETQAALEKLEIGKKNTTDKVVEAYKNFLGEDITAKLLFANIDNDDIPELILMSNDMTIDTHILFYNSDNEEVDYILIPDWGKGFSYIEKEGSILVSEGMMFVSSGSSLYSFSSKSGRKLVDYWGYYKDENGEMVYYINEEFISKEEYDQRDLGAEFRTKETNSTFHMMKFDNIQDAYDYYKGTFTTTYGEAGYYINRFEIIDGYLYAETESQFDDRSTRFIKFKVSPNCDWYRYYTSGERGDTVSYEIIKTEIDETHGYYANDRENYITDSATTYAIEVENNAVVAVYSINS